jgi:aspartyl-tRNA(Asn)/glutamyl-tRNA(Gln) amidotransferase subunit A
MHNATLTELSVALKNKKISSKELTKHFLARIKKYDPSLNSFITVTAEHALQHAEQADEQRKKGTAGPLTGIPIAHKDIFCTNGIKTSCASKMLDNFIAPYDATLVSSLNKAGTVLLGKTNMDEFAMGSSNETSFYGAVKNPWNLDHVPGGSSGGSSAAVAARLVPAATGTDTGGSIRQPAALCNLTGLKPTYGRVSRYGLIAFASSLDQAGPMTQTAEDAALLMNVMAGFDEKDSTSIDEPVPDYTVSLNNSLQGLKIGLPKEYFSAELDPQMANCIENAIKHYEHLGATIHTVSLPNCHLVVPLYYTIASAECSSNLARYDGIRYGYRCHHPKDLRDLYERTRAEGFGEEVKRRILMGTYVLSAGYYDAYYVKAQKIRGLVIQEFEQAFQQVDILLGPTTPSTAFKLGEKTKDPVSMYLSDIYTIAINLAGLPALSLPAGFIDGLPAGMQLIGRSFSEAKLLNVAHRYQQVTDWHTKIPENYK